MPKPKGKFISQRILVIGEASVGKTCFTDVVLAPTALSASPSKTYQFLRGTQFSSYNVTGTEDYRRRLKVDGEDYLIDVMDLSSTTLRTGDSSLRHDLFDQWIQDVDGVVLLYDITSQSSFDFVTNDAYWYVILHRRSGPKDTSCSAYPAGSERFGCILVGNKLDLAAERREVSTEQAQEWAESQGIPFFEMDSKSQEPTEVAVRALVRDIRRAEKRDAEDLEQEGRRQKKERNGRSLLTQTVKKLFRT